jgi:hypothetical protein
MEELGKESEVQACAIRVLGIGFFDRLSLCILYGICNSLVPALVVGIHAVEQL